MEEIIKSSTDKHGLIQTLATVDELSCPHRYNFHLHTLHSDGQCDPVDLFQQAIGLGLEGLAITDHHSVGGFRAVCDWISANPMTSPLLPRLWTGVEITSRLLTDDVHILGLAFDPNHPVMEPYLTGESVQGPQRDAQTVIDSLHEANGLALLAHPVRYRTDALALIEAAVPLGLDGIETFYCYGSDQPWTPSEPQTAMLKQVSDRYQLLSSCGTDTHGLSIIHRR